MLAGEEGEGQELKMLHDRLSLAGRYSAGPINPYFINSF